VFRAVLMLCLVGCSSVIAQDNVCGVDVLEAGALTTLTSPGYPSEYANGLDCSVTITAPERMLVHVTVDDFNLESHSSCGFDSLAVGDSGLMCGSSGQGFDYVSSGNVVTITFHTDGSVTRSGFSLSFEAVDPPTADICAVDELEAGVGYVQTPNYPEVYTNSLDCSITITAPEGMLVHVAVLDTFDLESHSSCGFDWVEMGDSGRMCGTAGAGFDYVSSGNIVTITFHTDGSVVDPGFSMYYEAVDAGWCNLECFEEHSAKHISFGNPTGGITTLCECKALCDSDDACIGFDFNNEVPPYQDSSCWIHNVEGDLIDPTMDVNHYANVC